mmetsp:Transcript_2164/g.7549  ORF Transcript_2164/g.7549 Transcript_2164/m.7549 type:complete len:754 (-) Transcript_2164:58-2319(-)
MQSAGERPAPGASSPRGSQGQEMTSREVVPEARMLKLSLVTVCLLALLVIIALLSLHYSLMRERIAQQEDAAHTINMAGRQRMLCEQITSHIVIFHWVGVATDSQREVVAERAQLSAAEWRLADLALREGREGYVGPNKEVHKLLDAVHPHLDRLATLAERTGTSPRQERPTLDELQYRSEEFILGMDAAVAAYEAEQEGHTENLLRTLDVLLVVEIIATVVIGAALALPLTQRLGAYLARQTLDRAILSSQVNGLETEKRALETEATALESDYCYIFQHLDADAKRRLKAQWAEEEALAAQQMKSDGHTAGSQTALRHKRRMERLKARGIELDPIEEAGEDDVSSSEKANSSGDSSGDSGEDNRALDRPPGDGVQPSTGPTASTSSDVRVDIPPGASHAAEVPTTIPEGAAGELKTSVEGLTYQSAAPIGCGGFARVFKGKWRGQTVAIKVMEYDRLDPKLGAALAAAAETESKVAPKLDHPNVVRTLHLSTHSAVKEYAPGVPTQWETVLVQEYCSGGSLLDALRSRQLERDGCGIPHPVLHDIATQVAEGMAYLMSSGVVHGDLKAANVLLYPDPSSGASGVRLKLTDFGTSAVMKEQATHATLRRMGGTVSHMAPELLSRRHISARSDVYAYGVLMWELVSRGDEPFPDANMADTIVGIVHHNDRPLFGEHARHAPQELVTLATRCWNRDPFQRPKFKGQVLEYLEAWGRVLSDPSEAQVGVPVSAALLRSEPVPTPSTPGYNALRSPR